MKGTADRYRQNKNRPGEATILEEQDRRCKRPATTCPARLSLTPSTIGNGTIFPGTLVITVINLIIVVARIYWVALIAFLSFNIEAPRIDRAAWQAGLPCLFFPCPRRFARDDDILRRVEKGFTINGGSHERDRWGRR